jgi:hypothetical protein
MTLSPYTGTLRGVAFGVGEDYLWGSDAPAGLGIPTPETTDRPLPGEGSVGGLDRVRRRVIRIPIVIVTDDGDAEDLLDDLKRAWRPSSLDTELDLRLGGDERRYYGRARGLEVDVTRVEQGVIVCVGNFDALDWLGYATTPTTVATDTSSPISITNSGTAPTTRCVLTINGNGGKPVLTNPADPHQGVIRFRTALANGQSATVDLTTLRVTRAGLPAESMVSPLSTWFVIEVGTNNVTFSGCTSVSAVVRPAYL